MKISNNKIQYVVCDFCKSKKSKFKFQHGHFNIVKCKFLYTNPRPLSEELNSFYNKDYFKSTERFSGLYSNLSNEEIKFKKKIEKIENWFNLPKRMLEIGCAEGELLNFLSKKGWEVEGIDISKYAVENGKKKYNLKLHNDVFESINFNEKFDVIAMYQSLEHMENPKGVIERCFDLNNKNGVIIIEVPNINSFDAKFSKKRKLLNYDPPYHLSHFSPKFLKKEFEKSGFEIVYIDYYQTDFVIALIKILNSVLKKKTTKDKMFMKFRQKTPNIKIKKSKNLGKLNFFTLLLFYFRGGDLQLLLKNNL